MGSVGNQEARERSLMKMQDFFCFHERSLGHAEAAEDVKLKALSVLADDLRRKERCSIAYQ